MKSHRQAVSRVRPNPIPLIYNVRRMMASRLCDGGNSWLEPRLDWVLGLGWRTS